MASALMKAEDSSIISENPRIAGLESQILNSQEIIVRLNRELDSALHRITTLENVCSENQTDLHEKRNRIKELNDEIDEREEINERLNEELKTSEDLINQLKQENEDKDERNNQYQLLFNDFGDVSMSDLHFQIQFDRQLRQLILHDLGDDFNLLNNSPQAIIEQYHHNERLKFHDLLQKSLITEDISNLIDSEDILFELLLHLNSLSRLKETLSRDSKELQHIRSLLHLKNENNDQLINDLINKRECIEYLYTKMDINHNLTDFELIKHVLHDYFNFQEQQNELKEYLQLNEDNDNDINYSRILIERFTEAIHVQVELNEHIQKQDQTIEQLKNQFNERIEQEKEIDEILSKFSNQSIDQDNNESSQLDRIRSIIQSNIDFQHALSSETSNDKHFDQNQQLIIDELTKEINQLKEETNHRKNQLKEITNSLESDSDDEETQLNLLRSSLQSLINFRHALSNKLLITDNNESILQRIDDYQLIINTLNSPKEDWTNETIDELMTKLQTMKSAENTIEDLQKRLDESINNEKQLQTNIKQIADQFAPKTDENEESDVLRIHQSLQSLTNFRQKLSDQTQMNTDEDILQLFEKSQNKQDAEIQTIDNDEFYFQIKELIGVEEDHPEEIMKKIRELLQTSQTKIDEYEKLRNLLNIEDDNLIESVRNLNENFHRLEEEHERLVQKENIIDQSIERMMNKIGLSSDSSCRTQIDELCVIFDTFCLEYCQLTSTDIEKMNLMEIFKHIQLFLVENNELIKLIDQIDLDQSSENLNSISKLQTYLTKIDTLCQLICNDNVNIDQALIMYQKKIEHDNDAIEKMSNFKQKLLTRLSIDNEEQIFDRLDEIEQINNNLKVKLQNNDDSASTLASLNMTISEQRNKILENEEVVGKLRSRCDRMLNKMKEMKINNETLTNQLNQANQSLDELHRKEIDYRNQIEEIEQQLRSANNQIQVTLDDCRTQQDLQETMKLEIQSIKNEMETQKKLYENRCRQIINEKKQLDKNTKELIEQQQSLEDENKRLKTILQTIKDTLENVDDINSIVDTILKLRHDHLILTNELDQRNVQIQIENEKLLLNIHQQESTINEYIQTKNELEKRLIDNEQQLRNFEKEFEENIDQYQRLQNEFQLYKENHQPKTNSQIAIINIEQSSPPLQPHLLAVQQAAESNDWMAIDMKDEEIPLATTNKHSTIDTPTALFNLLGELKSKLGITLTHRPRSSSVFFLYLCAVHLLTIYLLFIRRC